jgi:hypothetical protein
MTDRVANPRLIDVFGVDFSQDDVGFAIPRLHSDIPLYVDPFLLWISGNPTYRALHEEVISFLRLVSEYVRTGQIDAAAELLVLLCQKSWHYAWKFTRGMSCHAEAEVIGV